MAKKNKVQEELSSIPEQPVPVVETEEKKSVKNKLVKVINFLNSKYNFRYNVINTDTEFKKSDESEWRYFDDREYRDVLMDVKINGGFSITDQDFKMLIYSSIISKEYNPFKEYLSDLPRWDGTTDYIKIFLQQVYLTDESNRHYFIEAFRKWFVALVVSLWEDLPSPYYINQTCLVLVGAQGKYKTTFLKNIVPANLQLKYFYGSSFNVHNKDHEKYLAYKIIINLDELAALNKVDIESMKSKITQDQIVVRLPYAKSDVHLKRRASFCGTSNNAEFLKDDTGTRRFLVFEVDRMVLDSGFDVGFMYAQAWQLYKDGFQYWFDGEETQLIELKNQDFFFRGMEEELVMQYYRKPTEQEVNDNSGFIEYTNATNIAVALAEKSNRINVNNTVIKTIGAVLKKYGFKRTSKYMNGQRVKLWVVYRVPEPKATDIATTEGASDVF